MRKVLLIFSVLLLFTLEAGAQVHTCTDPEGKDNADTVSYGVYDYNKTWQPGSTLKIKFLNGDSYLQGKVMQYAAEWTMYANIKFDYVNSGASDIRIRFDNSGNTYSRIGTDARLVPQASHTVNFGWFSRYTDEADFKRTILHEFGHILGLLHEHSNPLSPIKWNKDYIYAYYLQRLNWSVWDVESNIFSRYSVNHTNKKYDRYSIMHYPIPKEFTLDGYSVGWNGELSFDDKQLARELYPAQNLITGNNSIASCELTSIKIEHNTYENGKKGMSIYHNMKVANAKDKKLDVIVYFYDKAGNPLKDRDRAYRTSSGDVCGYNSFTPQYQSSGIKNLKVFIPYDQLHLSEGAHNLKFKTAVWNNNTKLFVSGDNYFTYTGEERQITKNKQQSKEVVCNDLRIDVKHNFSGGMKIFPVFTVKNAEAHKLRLSAYFYTADGTPLMDYNKSYNTSAGRVATGTSVTPCCDITDFSKGGYYNVSMFMPYKELHLTKGIHTIKVHVVLWDGKKKIASSGWEYFKIEV
jgi:hypothetical protein